RVSRFPALDRHGGPIASEGGTMPSGSRFLGSGAPALVRARTSRRLAPAVFFVIVWTGLTGARPAFAQSPVAAPTQAFDVESLRREMQEMQAALRQMQIQHRQEVSALKSEVDHLHGVIDELRKTVATRGPATPPPAARVGAPVQATAAAKASASPPETK